MQAPASRASRWQKRNSANSTIGYSKRCSAVSRSSQRRYEMLNAAGASMMPAETGASLPSACLEYTSLTKPCFSRASAASPASLNRRYS
eukprot:767497-Hanusia_phi.AAC.2